MKNVWKWLASTAAFSLALAMVDVNATKAG